MSESPMGMPGRARLPVIRKPAPLPPPLMVLGENTVPVRIGGLRPALIARRDDESAQAVLRILKSFPKMDDIIVHHWQQQEDLCAWFVANDRTPNSCVAVLASPSLKDGTFTLAGARRGRAITRSDWQRGWVGSLGIEECWYQAIYLSQRFTKSHGPEGMANQIASWLRPS